MKILKDAQFDELSEKANNYDAIVTAMVAAGANADDIKPQSILDAMEPKDEADGDKPDVEALNQQIKTLTSERDALKTRAEKAEQRVTELEGLPADETAGGKTPKRDENADASLDELTAYAASHNKDQASVIEMVRKSGIV